MVDPFSHAVLILPQHPPAFRHIDFGFTSCCFPGSTAMMPGYQASDSENAYDFFLGFFFQSDRPTQYQETHSTVNKKKRGWPYGGLVSRTSRELRKITMAFSLPAFQQPIRSRVWSAKIWPKKIADRPEFLRDFWHKRTYGRS